MKKKLLSLVLAAVLCIPFLPFSTFADDTVITEVNVTVSLPLVNSSDIAVVYASAEPAKYTVTPIAQTWLDGGGYEIECFYSGCEYQIGFNVTPAAGYTLSPDAVVKVNGSTERVQLVGESASPASGFVFFAFPELLGEIDSIALTEVPEMTVGETVETYYYEGENFTAWDVWYQLDRETKEYVVVEDGETFLEGEIYCMTVSVAPKVGYILSDYMNATVNGVDMHVNATPSLALMNVLYNDKETIQSIEIDPEALPKAEIGKSFSDDTLIPVEVPVGSPYTVQGFWYCYSEDYEVVTEGTFEMGKVYYFSFWLDTLDGYSWSESLEMTFGGVCEYPDVVNPIRASFETRTSFATVLDEVELLGLTKPVEGTVLTGGMQPVSVPSGAHYKASVIWRYYPIGEQGWVDIAEGETLTASKGGKYMIVMVIDPEEGYEFAKKTVVKAMSEEIKVDYVGYERLYCERFFSLGTPIERIELTTVEKPKVGAAPVEEIKIPNNAHYSASLVWTNVDGEPVTLFEADQTYVATVLITPEDGYCLDYRLDTLLWDGEYIQMDTNNGYTVTKLFPLKDILPEIRLEHLPEMVVGEPSLSDVAPPADAPYAVSVAWEVWDDKLQSYKPFSGIFEVGRVYRRWVEVFLLDDSLYLSAKQTAFLVDGLENDNIDVLENNYASYWKVYETEHTYVERIEITVEEPKAGVHTSLADDVTFTVGAEFVDLEYLVWFKGGFDNIQFYDGFFDENVDYGIDITLNMKQGYVLSKDAVVVINGIILPADKIIRDLKQPSFAYVFGMTGVIEEPNSNSNPSNPPATNPPPTDTEEGAPTLWILLGAVGGAAVVAAVTVGILLSRRKKRASSATGQAEEIDSVEAVEPVENTAPVEVDTPEENDQTDHE